MIGPRFYYHGFVRNGMFFPIAGPFTTRDEADAIHDKAAAAAHRIDARTWFEQWGTAVLDAASRKGKLNAQLGL